jgi:hypothetical protein
VVPEQPVNAAPLALDDRSVAWDLLRP